MRAYLKPLRRKIGVIALVLSAILTGAWIRSLSTLDTLCYATTDHLWRLTIEEGLVELTYYHRVSGEPDLPPNTGWKSASNIDSRGRKSLHGYITANLAIADTKFVFYDFSCSTKKWITPTIDVDQKYYVVPYWSMVIPTTLLSACLLLSKPRATRPQPSTDSAEWS